MWDDSYYGYVEAPVHHRGPSQRRVTGHQAGRQRSGQLPRAAAARVARAEPLHTQRVIDADKDFVQHFLSWSTASVKNPLAALTSARCLPEAHSDMQGYLRSFLPFILDEARAIVDQGLKGGRKRSQREFNLQLTSSVTPAKNPGNPTKMEFTGRFPRDIEHSRSMLALLLVGERRGDKVLLLGLASENDGGLFSVKVRLGEKTYQDKRRLFQNGVKWEATYLGSLVTQERMYRACTGDKIAGSTLIRQIYGARLSDPRASQRQYSALHRSGYLPGDSEDVAAQHPMAPEGALNRSQEKAVNAFMKMREGVMLLQGPPGTGKTTTIVSLLRRLTDQRKRVLVTAPSNKAVQVLAERFLREHPNVPMILAGVESKVPDHLRPIFLHTWLGDILRCLGDAESCLSSILNYTPSKKDTLEKVKKKFLEKIQRVSSLLTQVHQRSIKYALHIRSLESQLAEVKAIQGAIGAFDPSQQRVESAASRLRAMDLSASARDFQDYDATVEMSGEASAEPRGQRETRALLESLKMMVQQSKNTLGRISREFLTKRETIEEILLQSSVIVFATLSVCGRHIMLEKMPRPDVMVVDEAAQSVEAETLIALQHNPGKLLLVGDTKQLPATVISKPAAEKKFEWSMMWRLKEEARQPDLMLDTQYRMDPAICEWPSAIYYEGELQTAECVVERPELAVPDSILQPIAFYDVSSGKQQSQGHSYSNEAESKYVVQCVQKIREFDPEGSIGVITFYRGQVDCIERAVRRLKDENLRVSTVDGFQGDECKFIIISCVRGGSVIGFIEDFRRLNVAITRAQRALILLGRAATLGKGGHHVARLIGNLRDRGFFYKEDTLKKRLGIKKKPGVRSEKVAGGDVRGRGGHQGRGRARGSGRGRGGSSVGNSRAAMFAPGRGRGAARSHRDAKATTSAMKNA